MSANKRRRSSISNSNNNCQLKDDQLKATKDMQVMGEGGERLEMPRVCRCCCKGDMELLSLFEGNDATATNHNQTTQTHQLPSLSVRRQKTTTASQHQQMEEEQQEQQQQHSHQQHKRNCDNPVDYALSSSHSSMDTVLEEMIIWMLNVSATTTI